MDNPNKHRFVFIIPSLDFGGAERICATYVNALSRMGHPCRVLLSENTIRFPLDPSVSTVVINSSTEKKGIGKLLFLVRYYRKLAKAIRSFSPDVLVSSLRVANVQTLIAAKLIPAPKRPLCIIRQEGMFREPPDFLTRRLYPAADMILAVSEGLRDYLIKQLRLPPGKVVTAHNPFDLKEVESLAEKEVDHPWFASEIPIIINVSRLVEQKNHRLLIRAFQQVTRKMPARLVLVGQGPLKTELEDLIARMGLSDSVCFLGFESNPYRYISRSQVFVLSSQSEGFGNVLVEAMCCGTPVISTDCEFGPKEIIEDGHSGYLVAPGNETALAERILQVLKSDNTAMLDNAKKAVQRYDLPNVMKQFLSLLPEK